MDVINIKKERTITVRRSETLDASLSPLFKATSARGSIASGRAGNERNALRSGNYSLSNDCERNLSDARLNGVRYEYVNLGAGCPYPPPFADPSISHHHR